MASSIERVYLDTNVFITMAEGDDDLASALYAMASEAPPDERFLCTSELTLAELIVHPYVNQNEPLLELYDNWITPGSGWLDVRPVDRVVLRGAAKVRHFSASIKLPDAIHLSTALETRCTHFLTGDKRIPDQITIADQMGGQTGTTTSLETLRLSLEMVARIRRSYQS